MKNLNSGFWKLELKGIRALTQIGIAVVLIALISGCSEKSSEPERTAHPMGWSDPTDSANFHGTFLAERGTPAGYQPCQECHGAFDSGGTTGFSCFSCHNQFPHPTGWSGAGTANLHQTYIQQKGWKLGECQSCHGADFRTAKTFQDTTTISCFTCHGGNSGPVGCRVCHGGSASSAPPADLLGGTSTDLITVGAHTAHVDEEGTFARVSCNQCHAGFDGYAGVNHIDSTSPGIADVQFGVVATDSGRISPVWDRNAGTCSSVYCHGSFDGGVNAIPNWTAGRLTEGCTSCHGLPPSTHTTPERQGACTSCHDFTQSTHVDGTVNFR